MCVFWRHAGASPAPSEKTLSILNEKMDFYFGFFLFFFPLLPSSSHLHFPRPAATLRWESCLSSITQLIGRLRGFPVVALTSHLPGDSDSPADTMSLGGQSSTPRLSSSSNLLPFLSPPCPWIRGGGGLSPAPNLPTPWGLTPSPHKLFEVSLFVSSK